MTQPFCGDCNRIRLTADGSIRNCLFAKTETSIRDMLRGDASDEDIVDAFVGSVAAKHAAHGIDGSGFQPPERPMYAIGG